MISKGSKMALVIGIVAAVAIVATVVAVNQGPAPNSSANNAQIGEQANTTGKKITIGLSENLGLKEKP